MLLISLVTTLLLYNGSATPKPKDIGDYFVQVFAPETATYYETTIDLGAFTIAPNTHLLSITVTGKKQSVTLPGDQFVYDIYVPTSDNAVTVSATAADPRATITGLGVYRLHPNIPTTITITVKAVNGATREYKINILRVLGQGNSVIRLE